MKKMKNLFANKKRLVIKIGSSLLVSEGKLRQKWLKSFVADVVELIEKKVEIAIVSSGSVALGRVILKMQNKRLSLKEKQAAAAVGQIHLMGFYCDFFAEYNLNVAQILLTAADCNDRERYLNSHNALETLLEKRVVPIINENDAIAVEGIKIGDNDRLAARVAQMISADLVILLSDINGLYDKNPRTEKSAKFISEVSEITKEIEAMAGGAGSVVGTGGMVTKILAAKMLVSADCETVITNGTPEHALKNLFSGQKNFTVFRNNVKVAKSRKKWISGFINVKGGVVVNARAAEALKNKKISLLPIGVVAVEGDFKKGDAVFIRDEEGIHIANGLSNYDADDAKKVLLKKSAEVKRIFGKAAKVELVHIDNLVVI